MFIDSIADEGAALSSAWRMQRTGNFVAAFDLAQEALRRWPGSRALEHLSILALASCGSTAAALDAFRSTSLRADANEDFLALEARLLKDLAFQDETHPEASLMRAAEAYERIAQHTDGTYSRQNAALLWMLAGDAQRAIRLAGCVAKRVTGLDVPAEEQAAYFHWATLAEAALVLGDRGMLERAVARANPLCRQNSWARSRTYLQMRRLSGLRPDCADAVEAWHRPPVGLVLNPAWLSPGPQSAPGLDAGDIPALAYCIGADREATGRRWPREGFSCTSSSPTRRATSPMSREPPSDPGMTRPAIAMPIPGPACSSMKATIAIGYAPRRRSGCRSAMRTRCALRGSFSPGPTAGGTPTGTSTVRRSVPPSPRGGAIKIVAHDLDFYSRMPSAIRR